MKKILVITMFLMAQQSFAVSPIGSSVLSANLTNMYIGHQYLERSEGGSVQIDLDQKVIQIFLNQRYFCPTPLVCAAVMPEDMVIEVPLIRQQTDSCGVVTYTAEVDNTIADGLRETIEVVDYQSATCMFVINTPTTIRYETFNPWTQTEETSNFDADFLRASAVIF
jgi:hypothetical protein